MFYAKGVKPRGEIKVKSRKKKEPAPSPVVRKYSIGKAVTTRQKMRKIVELVAIRNGVTYEDIFGNSRRTAVIHAKHEAAYRLRRKFPHISFPALGRFFGIDHSSVMLRCVNYAIRSGKPPVCSHAGILRSVERKRKHAKEYFRKLDKQSVRDYQNSRYRLKVLTNAG